MNSFERVYKTFIYALVLLFAIPAIHFLMALMQLLEYADSITDTDSQPEENDA